MDDDDVPWHLNALGIDVLHAQDILGAGVRICVIDAGAYTYGAALQHADVKTLIVMAMQSRPRTPKVVQASP